MPRIRTIKPAFFSSLALAALPRDVRLTFVGLWCYADDAGRGVDDPRLVKAAVWPLDDDVTPAAVEAHLAALAAAGMLVRYRDGARRLLAVRGFAEHQRINRPTPSEYPAPPERPDAAADAPAPSTCEPSVTAHAHVPRDGVSPHAPLTEDSLSPHAPLTEDSLAERKGREGKGREGRGVPVLASLVPGAADASRRTGGGGTTADRAIPAPAPPGAPSAPVTAPTPAGATPRPAARRSSRGDPLHHRDGPSADGPPTRAPALVPEASDPLGDPTLAPEPAPEPAPCPDWLALHRLWEERVGPVNAGRFRKAFRPLCEPAGGAAMPYPANLLARALKWYVAIRRGGREWPFVTPERFVAGVADHVRVARLPEDEKAKLLPLPPATQAGAHAGPAAGAAA